MADVDIAVEGDQAEVEEGAEAGREAETSDHYTQLRTFLEVASSVRHSCIRLREKHGHWKVVLKLGTGH